MQELTNKQQELYKTIKEFIDENGYAPTVRELCKLTNNKSTGSTFDKLKKLKNKGYITYTEHKFRTIRIVK